MSGVSPLSPHRSSLSPPPPTPALPVARCPLPASPGGPMSNRRATTFLLGTAFLSTMGFGVLGPVLPFLVSPYLGDGRDLAAVVGWLSSVYAICQVLASPGLGALSDR